MPKLKNLFINDLDFTFSNSCTEVLSYKWTSLASVSSLCKQLHTIAVDSCKDYSKMMKEFSLLQNLRKLVLIKLNSISLMCDMKIPLEELQVTYSSKLSSLCGVENFSDTLTMLSFENCKKLEGFNYFTSLSKLEHLFLFNCGKIPSLSFLRNMPAMHDIRFLGTEVIDGDLSACLGYDFVVCDNKKKYNYTAEQLMAFKGK